MAAFGIAALCSLVGIDRLIALMMEAVCSPETLVIIYETVLRNTAEDSHLVSQYCTHRKWILIM
jgi:hypothetical protein